MHYTCTHHPADHCAQEAKEAKKGKEDVELVEAKPMQVCSSSCITTTLMF
jgi:hypothetical protein